MTKAVKPPSKITRVWRKPMMDSLVVLGTVGIVGVVAVSVVSVVYGRPFWMRSSGGNVEVKVSAEHPGNDLK